MKKFRLFLIEFTYFQLSSMKAFIYKGLMGFLKMILIFFSVVKVVKRLILVGFVEVGIEVILVILRCFLIGNLIFEVETWM